MPDITLAPPGSTITVNARWGNVEMWLILLKDLGMDPFKEFVNTEAKSYPMDKKAAILRGELVAFATDILSFQNRHFLFSVLVMGRHARFIRWDRAGAIVSARFDYANDPDGFFADFMWRFSHMSPEQRGRDTTVLTATTEEVELAKLGLKDFADDSIPILKIRHSRDGKTADFLVWKPLDSPCSLLGRGTRAYAALDLQNDNQLVFLKDVWRPDNRDWPSEGSILRKLQVARVRHIPELLYEGDVDSIYARTRTQSYARKYRKNGFAIVAHVLVHYRLVTSFDGLPLSHFRNSKEMVTAVYHALLGECLLLYPPTHG